MKLTHSKTASRRAHHRTGAPSLVTTATGVRRRHFMDPTTGMYRGKQIITIGTAEKLTKSKRKASKEAKESNKGSSSNDEKSAAEQEAK